jgi:adenylate cyclase
LAAWCHIQRIWAESPDLSADLASALTHAKAVMTIRTDDSSTLAFAAAAYARAARDYETPIQMIEHALARNPSNAHALAVGAMVNVFAQRLDLTIELAERALRCSPFDPIRYLALTAMAHAKLLQGETEQALIAARRAVHASPGFLPTHGFVLICLVRLGRAQELRATVEGLLTSFPDLRLTNFTAHPPFEPFITELTAAGLPA